MPDNLFVPEFGGGGELRCSEPKTRKIQGRKCSGTRRLDQDDKRQGTEGTPDGGCDCLSSKSCLVTSHQWGVECILSILGGPSSVSNKVLYEF